MTCKEFALVRSIKAAIFKEVSLRATIFHVHRLRFPKHSGLLDVAQFVKKVIFLPSPFTPNLDQVFFREIIRDLHVHRPRLPLYSRRHIDTYWRRRIPEATNDSEVTNFWNHHLTNALRDFDYVRSRELLCLWTSSLVTLHNAEQFELSSLTGNHPLVGSYDIAGEDGVCANCSVAKYRLRYFSRGQGAELFQTATQCLFSLQRSRLIKSFSISIELAAAFTGWRTVSWLDLDLSRLEELTIPSCASWDDEAGFRARAQAMESALVQVLQKPLPSLKHLDISHFVFTPLIKWPHQHHTSLPRLQSLHLCGLNLRLRLLASTMASCPDLRTISISDCRPAPKLAGPDGWKVLFDAVIGHQNCNSMHLTFDEVWDKDYGLNFSFDRATFRARTEPINPHLRELFMYLAGSGPWTEYLRTWFELDDGDA
jgi:hypothetical protein